MTAAPGESARAAAPAMPAMPAVGVVPADVPPLIGRPRGIVVRPERPAGARAGTAGVGSAGTKGTRSRGGRRSLRRDRQLVADVARRLSASLDLGAILIEVMRLLHERFGYGNAAIFLASDNRRWLVLRAAYGEMTNPEEDIHYRQHPEQGLIGQAFSTGEVVRVDDVRTDPRYLDKLAAARSELCVPLHAEGEVMGVLDIQLREAHGFRDQDELLLREVGQHLAPVLRNAALYERSRRREAELQVVAEVARAISSRLHLHAVLDEIHRQIRRVMVVDSSSVALEAHVLAAVGEVQREKLDAHSDVPSESGAGEVGKAASTLVAPMMVGEEALGVLSVQSREEDAYDDWHEQVLATIANQAAVAIHNARLFALAGEVEALRALNAMKDQFIDTVSHELRTPIASIYGFAELLAGGQSVGPARTETVGWADQPPGPMSLTQEQQLRAARHLYVAADHMRRLVDDLLDAGRLARGVLTLEMARVDVRRALEEAREIVQSSLGTGQRVVLELPAQDAGGADADDLTVAADPARLRQVLLNLLRNASLYSPEGSTIRLGADRSSRSAANAREQAGGTRPRRHIVGGVHLWVADEGVGLTADECERVFERFWRGPLSVTSGRPGAGLGLSICRGLAEAMDGRIWAESAGPGKGSTFHLVLPEAASDIMSASTAGAAGDSAGASAGDAPLAAQSEEERAHVLPAAAAGRAR